MSSRQQKQYDSLRFTIDKSPMDIEVPYTLAFSESRLHRPRLQKGAGPALAGVAGHRSWEAESGADGMDNFQSTL